MKEDTALFNIDNVDKELAKKTIDDVYKALSERGYNPTAQIVGYLISGDPGYISSYKEARLKIRSLDRAKIVEVLLEKFRKNK